VAHVVNSSHADDAVLYLQGQCHHCQQSVTAIAQVLPNRFGAEINNARRRWHRAHEN
jgi:Fe-S cluster biogenesis protein NfuA